MHWEELSAGWRHRQGTYCHTKDNIVTCVCREIGAFSAPSVKVRTDTYIPQIHTVKHMPNIPQISVLTPTQNSDLESILSCSWQPKRRLRSRASQWTTFEQQDAAECLDGHSTELHCYIMYSLSQHPIPTFQREEDVTSSLSDQTSESTATS